MRLLNSYRVTYSRLPLLLSGFTAACITLVTHASPQTWLADTDLTELSLEELLSIEVTSVSKKAQRLSETAAAVFVITQEDIRRSGATSIPEVLRMVPGLQVARIDANKWAISARGFNGRFANKLLVLMDGRTVYTPSFSGVYWDAQDTLLEDIERIEVIRGPGASVWGANAVNGVINVITKNAEATAGTLVNLPAGSKEGLAGGFRYGKELAENMHGRFYIKYFDREEFIDTRGEDAGDDWNMLRGGFRLDWQRSDRDSFTVQGDVYNGDINQKVTAFSVMPPFVLEGVSDEVDTSGMNILGRWQRTLSFDEEVSLQVYYDRTDRNETVANQVHDTMDVEFKHRVAIGQRHDLVWGLGYRRVADDFDNTFISTIIPKSRNNQLYSLFIQDDIKLVSDDSLILTLGSKFEHNDYTGFEIQPTARLLWKVQPQQALWAAVSRAVRTPSRAEHDGQVLAFVAAPGTIQNPGPLPVLFTATGDSDFESEELLAYEFGYRVSPSPNLSLDLALFYHNYDHLRTNEPVDPILQGTSLLQPLVFDNKMDGQTYGVELAASWRARDWWRFDLAYTLLQIELELDADSSNSVPEDIGEGSSPQHQISLLSSMALPSQWELDLWARYVDDLPQASPLTSFGQSGEVDAYVTLDVKLAWRPRQNLEFAVVGQNLLEDKHLEFIPETFTLPAKVERSVYGQFRATF